MDGRCVTSYFFGLLGATNAVYTALFSYSHDYALFLSLTPILTHALSFTLTLTLTFILALNLETGLVWTGHLGASFSIKSIAGRRYHTPFA